jgi:hypothetical protein
VVSRHLKTVHSLKVPTEYRHQIQWEAWVSRRPKIIFVSYDPRQPLATQMAIVKVDADPDLWTKFERNSDTFRTMFETGDLPAVTKFKGFAGSAMPQFI